MNVAFPACVEVLFIFIVETLSFEQQVCVFFKRTSGQRSSRSDFSGISQILHTLGGKRERERERMKRRRERDLNFQKTFIIKD